MSYQLRPAQQQEGGYDGYGAGHGYGFGQGQAYVQPPIQQPQMVHPQPQPPAPGMMYWNDGWVRTHTWIANQPPVLSPPPTTKTPFSEYTQPGTESTWDRGTLAGGSTAIPPRPPTGDKRIWGIKRNHFFIILAVGFLLLVVAVAIGLGVGLGTRKSSNAAVSASADGASSATPSSTPPTSTAATATNASPTPSFTGTLVPGPVVCPQNNNTVYVASGSSKPFNVQCGRDYNSDDGARDITHMAADSMAECIDTCGRWAGCVGVGYGQYDQKYQCWLKSKLGKPNWSKQWYFAQLQDTS